MMRSFRAVCALLLTNLPSAQTASPPFAQLDAAMEAILARNRIPGAQLAIARDGRLVLSRAYGYADVEARQPVRTDSLFRIASVSKPVTAAAILQLIEQDRLRLHDKAFHILRHLQPIGGKSPDRRLYDITIRDLLQHAGGWDQKKSFDPMFVPWLRVEGIEFSNRTPPDCSTIIRIIMARPLDFEPGTQSAYSNFGYCVLGAIIEATAGTPYELFVRESVLRPIGITAMRLGRTRLQHRAENEVRYYGSTRVPAIYDGEGEVPQAYGGYSMEALAAAGGWLASAQDLIRIALAVDGTRGALPVSSRQLILDTPKPARPEPGAPHAAGLGWTVKRKSEGYEFQHSGWLPGTSASAVFRMANGTVVAILFNAAEGASERFFNAEMPALLDPIHAVKNWPTHDLFSQPSPGR